MLAGWTNARWVDECSLGDKAELSMAGLSYRWQGATLIVVSRLEMQCDSEFPTKLEIANRAPSLLRKLQTRIVQAEPLHLFIESRTIDIQCVSC